MQGVGSGGVVSQTQLRESQLNFMQAYLRRWCLESECLFVQGFFWPPHGGFSLRVSAAAAVA